jgi:hypothetical protein
VGDEEVRDFFLGDGVSGLLFAYVDALGVRGSEGKEGFGGEVVVEDDVGLREEAAAFDGEEFGVAGAGADEVYRSVRHGCSVGHAGSKAGMAS